MKNTSTITTITPSSNIHSALGREYFIIMSNGTMFKMWAEWFWYLDSSWNGDPNNRLGLELSPEWVENYKN